MPEATQHFDAKLAYATFGALNAERDNAILVPPGIWHIKANE